MENGQQNREIRVNSAQSLYEGPRKTRYPAIKKEKKLNSLGRD